MPDMLLLPGEIVSMPGAAADRLITGGNGDSALLYLWLLRHGGQYDPRAATHTLKWDPPRTEAAFAALASAGLADKRVQPTSQPLPEPDEPPDYSSADIAHELEDGASPFPGLVSEVQRRLGKILSTADLKMLYSLYDYLALPAEVILLLVNWCVEEMERKYGPGRLPRMSQIRKEAFAWQRSGVDTPEAAEAHLRRQSSLRTRENCILPLLDIKGRPPVEAERKYICSWVDLGFEDEAIRLAYERTVLKKQSMNWPYMNSILRSWHQKGLHTVSAIQAGDSQRPAAMAPAPSPAAPGEADRRAREDMERLREFMRRERGDHPEVG